MSRIWSIRKSGFVGYGLVLICGGWIALHALPSLPAYRHFRVRQTIPFSDGATMTVDDAWTVHSGTYRFLRVLCHWSNGFPPDDYTMKASLLGLPGGDLMENNLTWYVPMPKAADTPKGVAPFFWEFRIPPALGNSVDVRIVYKKSRGAREDLNAGVLFGFGTEKRIEFRIPNVTVERDMSVPDIFAASF